MPFFQIIVAEDYRKSTSDKPNLPKWQDVQKIRTWPPYQVSDAYYPFNNSSVEDFTIGEENCDNKVSSETQKEEKQVCKIKRRKIN